MQKFITMSILFRNSFHSAFPCVVSYHRERW